MLNWGGFFYKKSKYFHNIFFILLLKKQSETRILQCKPKSDVINVIEKGFNHCAEVSFGSDYITILQTQHLHV